MIEVSVIAGERAGTIPVEMSFFPCGERKVTLGRLDIPDGFVYDQMTVFLKYESDQDVMDMLLVVDAIKRCPSINYKFLALLINYFPYGRQDRVANYGEPHSLKVMTNLINSCSFDRVFVVDPHSDVIEALVDNLEIVTMDNIVFAASEGPFNTCDAFVSPDAGAYKKVMKCAQIDGKPVIRADKTRDTMTGQLSGFEVYTEDLTGQSVVILDDICDGGGTFIGLAEKLREKGAERIALYVTHGKFTKGVEKLLKSIDEIWCYDYTGPQEDADKVFDVQLFRE